MTNVAQKNCLENFAIYCGTYAKYNSGSIEGAWLNLSDYQSYDELLTAMKKLHKDEKYPEFHFQDYECDNFFINQNLVCEGYLSREIYDIADKIDNSSLDIEIIGSFVDCFGQYTDVDELISSAEENYYGCYDSDEDFAENLLQEMGTIPESLPSYVYIDYERTARDLMFDFNCSNKHYFRNF